MKAQAYEFALMVDLQIEALSDNDYHRKVGRSKVLQEELYPLSRLGLHFKQPGIEVEVEGFENSGLADGQIVVTGFRERTFEVQLTYAGYSRDEALRAELLVSQGFAPGAGPIRKDRRNSPIVATMQAVDLGEHIDRIASAVMERFRNKANKCYALGTVLLIAFDDVKLCGRWNWEQLLLTLEGEITTSGTPFAEIYLFNGESNELRRVA
ncbi:MAG: hypothetical protein ABL858_04260 [Candidatus Nitrotoga sp.]